MNKTNYTRRAVYNTIIVLTFSILATIFSYLFKMILARKLSLEEFGLFYSIVAFLGILNIFRDLGMNNAAVFFFPRFLIKNDKGHIKGLLKEMLGYQFISNCLIIILMILFSEYLVNNYFQNGSTLLLMLFVIAYFFNSTEISFQILFNAFQDQFFFSLQNLLRNFLIFIMTFIGLIFFKGILVPILVQITVYILLLVVFASIFFKKHIPNYTSIKAKYMDMRKLAVFGFTASIAYVGYLIITASDILFLTYFCTLKEVGLYSGVISIISLLLFIPSSINAVVFPITSQLWVKKRVNSLKFLIEKSTLYMIVAMVPIIVTIILYSKLILSILFGKLFSPGGYALTILAYGSLFLALGSVYSLFLLGIKGQKTYAYVNISVAAVSIILNILLIQRFGIEGAAISAFFSYALLMIVSVIVLRHTIKFNFEYFKYTLIIFIGSLFMILFNYLKNSFNISNIMSASILLLIFWVGYIASMFMFKIISYDEVKEIIYQIRLTK
jgi:O-antigen/teichoic acid export membrane protein